MLVFLGFHHFSLAFFVRQRSRRLILGFMAIVSLAGFLSFARENVVKMTEHFAEV